MKRSREPEESPSPSTPGSDDLEPPTPDERALPQGNHNNKIAELDLSDSETASSPAMRCFLHKDALFFGSYDEYESHYSKAHLNKCLECRKNFPSAHLLAVHIEECHDAFAAVRREKGEHTYTCFVEGCDRKCATPDKRRRHLIDKHLYPKNFFFAVTRDGIDGRQSLLQDGRYGHRRKSSGRHTSIKDEQRRASIAESSSSAEGKPKAAPAADKLESGETRAKATEDPREVPDVDMDDLTGAMSALKFVPPSIRFGRGGRAGFSRR